MQARTLEPGVGDGWALNGSGASTSASRRGRGREQRRQLERKGPRGSSNGAVGVWPSPGGVPFALYLFRTTSHQLRLPCATGIGSTVSTLQRRALAHCTPTAGNDCCSTSPNAAHVSSVFVTFFTYTIALAATVISMDFMGQLPGLPHRLTRLYSDSKHSADAVTEQEHGDDAPELTSLHRKFRIQRDRYIAWGLEVCIT